MKQMIVPLLLFFVSVSLASDQKAGRHEWLSVADRVVSTDPESYPFNWGEGVQMSGLMQVYSCTKKERYADFVERWAAFHLPKGTQTLLRNNPESDLKGYCGPWVSATVLVLLYEVRKNPDYLRAASETAQFVRAGATRSPEGAPGHWQGNYQIWVDTLYMSCPLLSRLSKVESRPAYIDDAVNQLLAAAGHMQESRNRLFFHMYDWQFDRLSEVQWGRGNGWAIMSLADTLEFLPRNHPRYRALKDVASQQARGLLAVQDRLGLWHTVITDPQSPAECSATTMITYGLLKLVRLGVLPARYRESAQKAWMEVNQRWVKDGIVVGVSEGTGPQNRAHYYGRKLGTYTWGTGSYLMAGSEMDLLFGGKK